MAAARHADDRSLFHMHSRIVGVNAHGDGHVNEATYRNVGSFVAGGVASMTSRTVTAPVDRLKIYLISKTTSKSPTWQHLRQGAPGRAVLSAGARFAQASREIWNAGGVRSLWAGNALNIVKMFPEGAIKFGVYEATRRFFAVWEGVDGPSEISVWAQTASGGIGGVAAQLAAYPFDTLRFRMQCNSQRGGEYGHRLLKQTAQQMWRSGGYRAYFRGLIWGLVGQFPYSAIDLSTYEYTRRWWFRRNTAKGIEEDDARPGAVATAAIGGFGGALGASMVWPLNLLRTRLQTSGTIINPKIYTSIMDVARRTISEEGFRGLWKGMLPNLIKVVPSVAVTYMVYDKGRQALGIS